MCYYISLTPSRTDIELRFGVDFLHPESHHQVYSASAFSYPPMPVISSENSQFIEYYRWGLIPSWVKDSRAAQQIRSRTLNARSVTIFEKPSFRQAIRSRRCLVLADGFFEWRHENRNRYPYYIRLASRAPFAIAGIWDAWVNPETEEGMRTFSVITTQANSLLKKVHNTRERMPAILQREYEGRWLADNLDEATVRSMLNPYDAQELHAYAVPSTVNRLGINTTNPGVLDEYVYPDLPGLDE
jgi:putative SOS response-associated peptidase YedK